MEHRLGGVDGREKHRSTLGRLGLGDRDREGTGAEQKVGHKPPSWARGEESACGSPVPLPASSGDFRPWPGPSVQRMQPRSQADEVGRVSQRLEGALLALSQQMCRQT